MVFSKSLQSLATISDAVIMHLNIKRVHRSRLHYFPTPSSRASSSSVFPHLVYQLVVKHLLLLLASLKLFYTGKTKERLSYVNVIVTNCSVLPV